MYDVCCVLRVACYVNKTTITYDHIATRYAARATYPLEQELTRQAGQERFFAYYQPEEIDRLIQAGDFEIVDGWISPPGEGQRHNWLNRFAVVCACRGRESEV